MNSAKSILSVCLLGYALVAFPATSSDQKKPKPRGGASANRAQGKFSIGDFEAAREVATAVLEAYPDDFRAATILGQVALLENRLEEAEGWLHHAIELKPTHQETRRGLLETYYRQKRFDLAAPLALSLGEESRAAELTRLAEVEAYRVDGVRTALPFVQTDPLPVVRLTINDSEPAAFIIDTGAAEIYLDTEWASELDLEVLGSSKGTFAGGKRAGVGHAVVDRVGLGELSVHNVPVNLLDTTPFSAVAPGEDIRGVLGTGLLYQFLATIDYPGGQLVLEPRVPAEDVTAINTDDNIRIPFRLAGSHYIVAPGTLNDSDPQLFFVDTGLAGYAFTCPESTLDEGEIEIDRASKSEGIGGGGKVQIVPFLLEKLRLGEAERQQLPGVYGPFPAGLEHGQGFPIDGIVSHGFFRPWAVTFDFDAMELILRSPTGSSAE
jgi:hypothetical protein